MIKPLLPNDCMNEPYQKLKFITKNNLSRNFPNLSIALRILLTLPVSVASGERNFSKLKLIKDYLSCTMSQERFVGLSFMSVEQEILNNLNLDTLTEEFAKMKSRKVEFK